MIQYIQNKKVNDYFQSNLSKMFLYFNVQRTLRTFYIKGHGLSTEY